MTNIQRCNTVNALVVPALLIASLAASGVVASAETLPGCASGAAPGQIVYTVGVSASGKPFVSSYVASPPVPGGNVGCAAPSGAATFTVNGPGVAVYPQQPVTIPANPSVGVAPSTVHMLHVGQYLLTVPAVPGLQTYQIASGYYVVRSTDPNQNPSVIVLPLPGVPQAPNTGPIPSVIH